MIRWRSDVIEFIEMHCIRKKVKFTQSGNQKFAEFMERLVKYSWGAPSPRIKCARTYGLNVCVYAFSARLWMFVWICAHILYLCMSIAYTNMCILSPINYVPHFLTCLHSRCVRHTCNRGLNRHVYDVCWLLHNIIRRVFAASYSLTFFALHCSRPVLIVGQLIIAYFLQ